MATLRQLERVEGYEAFFGLTEPPFSLAPDPRFLFASASHSAALAQVVYALERREPLVVITGEIGTGKTLLCRTVLQRLRRKTFLSIINDPLLERDDLLKQLLQDFGVISKGPATAPEARRHELIQTLHAFLRSLAPIQAHAVVIIDEAQHLQPDVLEQIRLLSNIDDERGTLLQIILVGQTGLDALLSRPELRQLQQRVSRRFRLEPLNRDEVQQYITHRLAFTRDEAPPSQAPGAIALARELADWGGVNPGVEFTAEAFHAVSEISGGLPRVINLLCDRSLEEAYALRRRIVDGPSVHSAARALGVDGEAAAAAPDPTTEEPALAADAERDEFWTVSARESKPGDSTVARTSQPLGEPSRSRPRPLAGRYLMTATSLAVVVAVAWFGVGTIRSRVRKAPAPVAAPAPSAARASSGLGGGAPAGPPAPGAAVIPPVPPRDSVSHDSVAGAAGTNDRYDIVVASFRTEARAASVAGQVAALGLPIRRRFTPTWQQVLTGPFASREDAAEAQLRLNRVGLTGTQIVPTAAR